MQLHELIDREAPRCLYCNYDCDLKHEGFPISNSSNINYEVQILICRKCKEVFEIRWIDDAGEIEFQGFAFSCYKIGVYNRYDAGFSIGDLNHLFKNWSTNIGIQPYSHFIPSFPVDFSDKKKLHKKLKTYLVFS